MSEYIPCGDLHGLTLEHCNKVPKVVHRTLLFDDDFPEAVAEDMRLFDQHSEDYVKVLWRERDLLEILTPEQKTLYSSYGRKIQKADYARYAILTHFGGIYADFDIRLTDELDKLMQANDREFLALEEVTLPDKFREGTANRAIRQGLPDDQRMECPLRIANFFMASSKACGVWDSILALCAERHSLEIKEDYDIIFTTGPDVVSTVIDRLLPEDERIRVLHRPQTQLLSHNAVGHWRRAARY